MYAPKIAFNITTDSADTERYENREDFLTDLKDFDGVELMPCGPDTKKLFHKGDITGVHLTCFSHWVDFWNQDEEALLEEYGSLEVVEMIYGGLTPQALVDHYKRDIEVAKELGGNYVVFHVDDYNTHSVVSAKKYHTDEQVMEATSSLADAIFKDDTSGITLLLENQWGEGFRFDDPAKTKYLLDGMNYAHTGIMLDVGHLLHTNLDLQTEDEAVDFILQRMDEHEDMLDRIKGIHLQQSITGDYVKKLYAEQPELPQDYMERFGAAFRHILNIDLHKPWTTPRCREFIDRAQPEVLIFEFMSRSREEHTQLLQTQWDALQGWKPLQQR